MADDLDLIRWQFENQLPAEMKNDPAAMESYRAARETALREALENHPEMSPRYLIVGANADAAHAHGVITEDWHGGIAAPEAMSASDRDLLRHLGATPVETSNPPNPLSQNTLPKEAPMATHAAPTAPAAPATSPGAHRPAVVAANKPWSTIGKDLLSGSAKTAVSPVLGVKSLWKAEADLGSKIGGALGSKLGTKFGQTALKTGLKSAGRLLPGVGMVIGAKMAYDDFKEGDYLGAALNTVGMIPGPIGWCAIGLSLGKDLLFGDKTYDMWEAPDGTNTHILQGSAKGENNVAESDAALTAAQQAVFSFQDGPDGTVWNKNPPDPLTLNTAEVTQAATDWLNGITAHFAAVDTAMTNAGEQYFTQQREGLVPHFTAMAALNTNVTTLTDQLTAASNTASDAYHSVYSVNTSSRTQLAEDGKISDTTDVETMNTNLQTAQTSLTDIDSKISNLFSETPPPLVEAKSDSNVTAPAPTPTPAPEVTTPAPAATTPSPSVTTPSPAVTTPEKTETGKDDELKDLLSKLGDTPTTATPSMDSPSAGGGTPLSTGSGTPAGGGTPLTSTKPETSDDKDKKLLDDEKDKDKDKDDEKDKKLSDHLKEKEKEEPELSAPVPEQAKTDVPAAPAPAEVTPVPAATAMPPTTGQPAAPGKPEEVSKEVDVKGTKTTFPDVKTAKLAELLANADPTHPLSLADAASQAGLTPPVPGQDPGQQVSPADAKPGDIMVAGDKNYMLLGDGKFYDLTEYKVVGASEIPQTMGDRAGYFHLGDPTAGTDAPLGAVSGQTEGVNFSVPGATGADQGPVDTSPQPATGAAAPGSPPVAGVTPATGEAPGSDPLSGSGGQPPTGGQPPAGENPPGGSQPPPSGPGGVPSTGSPGVPSRGTGGPSGAADTETGTGSSVPSGSSTALDPSAVR